MRGFIIAAILALLSAPSFAHGPSVTYAQSCWKGDAIVASEKTICPTHDAECELTVTNGTSSTWVVDDGSSANIYDCNGVLAATEIGFTLFRVPRPVVGTTFAPGEAKDLYAFYDSFRDPSFVPQPANPRQCEGLDESLVLTLKLREQATGVIQTYTHTFPVHLGVCRCTGVTGSCPPDCVLGSGAWLCS